MSWRNREANQIEYGQLRDEFVAFYWSHGKDACVNLLREFEVDKLSWLKPERYAEFSEAMANTVPTAGFIQRLQLQRMLREDEARIAAARVAVRFTDKENT